jgi:hypothetical protein
MSNASKSVLHRPCPAAGSYLFSRSSYLQEIRAWWWLKSSCRNYSRWVFFGVYLKITLSFFLKIYIYFFWHRPMYCMCMCVFVSFLVCLRSSQTWSLLIPFSLQVFTQQFVHLYIYICFSTRKRRKRKKVYILDMYISMHVNPSQL